MAQGANIYAVARRAEVSIATVSRVERGSAGVAPDTRSKVLDAISALSYRPSPLGRALAERRHGATGIVFPDLSGPYYSEVLRGYEDQAVKVRQAVLILGTHGRSDCENLVLDLAGRVDGLLIMGRTVDDRVVAELEERGVPVVLLARPPVGAAPAVRAHSFEVAALITQHLFEHGHRQIAFIGDPELSPDAAERWRGFLAAHAANGVTAPSRPVPSTFRVEAGRRAASVTLDQDQPRRPSALVCANDEIAIGACQAAAALGARIPDDVAVTGWDDILAARLLRPALTTVRQPMHALGAEACSLLIARIEDGDAVAQDVYLESEMQVRESCGCHSNERGGR